ncbi:MAG: ArsR family transcriptional regulator [Euryarchaeota archaeon TMED99]|nr:MAG: ArsR family transcriptional regulator [Euryarchaeota archaeon TMED99]
MAGDTRSTVALFASLLLLSSLPLFAIAETSDVVFSIEEEPQANQWYEAEDILQITAMFTNTGSQTSIENDPSCGSVLQVSDAQGTLIIDESSSCRGQTQSIDLAEGETYSFEPLTWNLQDEAGEFVEPGIYTVSAFHSATQSVASKTIQVQTPVEVSGELELLLDLTTRLNEIQQEEEVILGVTLRNPTSESIPLPLSDGCLVKLDVNEVSSLNMPCFAGFQSLEPYEQTLLGHVLFEDASLVQGLNTIQASLPTQLLSNALSFTFEDSTLIDTSLQDILVTEVLHEESETNLYSQGDIFRSSILMSNDGQDTVSLKFTDSCRAEMWIVDEAGDIMFDSRMLKNCNALELDYILDENEQVQFTLPDWTFTDLEGCEVASGDYTMVAEIPEFHLSSIQTIHYEKVTSTLCKNPLSVEMIPEITSIEGGFDLVLEVSPLNDEVDLRWIGPCAVMITIIDLSTIEEVHSQALMCDSYDGRHFVLPSDDNAAPLQLQVGSVDMLDMEFQPLPDGEYQMVLSLETNPQTRAGFVFSWPIADEETPMEQSVEVVVEQQSRLLSGTWSGLQTEMGTCWMFESPDEGQLLLSSAILGQWVPQQGWSGTYEVVDSPAARACANFQAPSFQVRSIEAETPIEVTTPPADIAEKEATVTPQEQVVSLAPSVLVVVTTGSILSLLVTLVFSNESLRIPSTAAGLWFLGLLGRTHETTDGRYQRGRLMGYLTANPGCHFRALMAALDMSNGQITHHLRILEAEEAIWRRKDGRLVRYYPLTNSLYPSMAEDDLPVPPLSPDPNSLQGKILTLLDRDGPLGEFPTQAELAVRLEKSQQLVSHHLRTLQKFGLVEKRKMGLKNRYKLTREAIFLLETNTDFTRED